MKTADLMTRLDNLLESDAISTDDVLAMVIDNERISYPSLLRDIARGLESAQRAPNCEQGREIDHVLSMVRAAIKHSESDNLQAHHWDGHLILDD